MIISLFAYGLNQFFFHRGLKLSYFSNMILMYNNRNDDLYIIIFIIKFSLGTRNSLSHNVVTMFRAGFGFYGAPPRF